MNFNDAKWIVQVEITLFLDKRNIPFSFEIGLWLTNPQLALWVLGGLIGMVLS